MSEKKKYIEEFRDKFGRVIPLSHFENDPPPGDDVDTSPGSMYDRLGKIVEEAKKKIAEKKNPTRPDPSGYSRS
jgi:hypothetical protein